ncbi:MAG: translation initiation factor [Nitrospirae bacterium]|nr:translation initiation factor [Nitrospirota bacterium]MCL5421990.1 translation initiation factor [Nitrospirota bacterium]
MSDGKSKLVYSTEQAIPRPGNHQEKKSAEKDLHSNVRPVLQKVTVRLDRKGRGGKSVTVIGGLRMPQSERDALLKQLKAMLGTGGTVRDTTLEIQGDHCDVLMAAMEKMGYRPKRSGG